jgi:hypothetical protein
VELVEEQEEVAPLVLRLIHTGHRPELELCGEQSAKQVGFIRAEFSFREIGDEDAACVHHERNAHLGARLAKDVSDIWFRRR